MSKFVLIIRSTSKQFYSIERVFNRLNVLLNAAVIVLPHESKGLIPRIKNIVFLLKNKVRYLHITGHDHYLLWFPFKNAILTIHDIEALKRKSGVTKLLFRWFWFDIPIKNARAITTISEFTKLELLKINRFKTPIHVIPNPLPEGFNYIPKVEWSEKLKILHIGTKKNKNLTRLIQALNGINCELTILGKLNGEILKELSQNKISFVNKVNLADHELTLEYQKTELVAFVSTYEGFGLPIIEAQAIGRVVITSDKSSMPEVAGTGAYFVNPFSVESIRDGIQKLKKDEKLRKVLIEDGLKNCERFNPEIIADLYKKLYLSLEN